MYSVEEADEKMYKSTPTVEQLVIKYKVPKRDILIQLDKGIKVELEHTSDRNVARKIALDHLNEDPHYYNKLAKVGLEESFDKSYPLTWETSENGDVDALATLSDGKYLNIQFNKQQNDEGEETIQVRFFRNNSEEVTGEGDAQKVFGTVLIAIQQYIKEYKPLRINFSASKEEKEDENGKKNPNVSRAKLYDRMVQRYARIWGYRAFQADIGDNVIYELSRINRDVVESSGYIPSEKQKNDPRFKTALTVDVNPYSIKKNAKAFSWLTSRAGVPPTAKVNGKIS
jgi:hypothetical protein